MTDEIALREAAEAATPGPWQLSGIRHTSAPALGRDTRLLQVGPDGDGLAMVFFDMQTGKGHPDARFIALANPAAIIALLDTLAAERAARERAEAMLGDAAEQIAELRAGQVYKDLQSCLDAHNKTLTALAAAQAGAARLREALASAETILIVLSAMIEERHENDPAWAKAIEETKNRIAKTRAALEEPT